MLLTENPSQTPWELEIIIPICLYTYACGFPQLLPLNFHTIKRLIAQTLTTPFQSVKWGFGAAGKHWKKPGFGGCNRVECGIWKAGQDTVSEKPYWSRSMEGLGTAGRLGLEGLLLTQVFSTDCLVDRLPLGGWWRGFSPSSSVSSSITH